MIAQLPDVPGHTETTTAANPSPEGGSRMTSGQQARKHQRGRAARQARTLCEAGQHIRPRSRTATARAALRAVGLPPLASALRGRLRLTPERQARR
jgi:hypothetical protein